MNEKLVLYKAKLRERAAEWAPRFKLFGRKLLSNWVLIFAVLSAVVSCFFVKPDAKYADYIQYKTLASLFSLMLVMRGFKDCKFFKIAASKILEKVTDRRALTFLLVFLPALLALVVTNDVALLTFVPFTIIMLRLAKADDILPRVIILQTMACQLSGLVSPLGNAQNLFLIDFYGFSGGWFLKNLWPLALAGYGLTALLCLTVKRGKIDILAVGVYKLPYFKITLYSLLTILIMLGVFKVVPFYVPLIATVVIMLAVNRRSFVKVNYQLLIMFIAFFILAGNLARIKSVDVFLTNFLNGREFFSAVLISQVLTNTPVAMLFPQFTANVLPLMYGINVGKFGGSPISNFMVARMFKKYDTRGNFFKRLMLANLIYLAVMTIVAFLYLKFGLGVSFIF